LLPGNNAGGIFSRFGFGALAGIAFDGKYVRIVGLRRIGSRFRLISVYQSRPGSSLFNSIGTMAQALGDGDFSNAINPPNARAFSLVRGRSVFSKTLELPRMTKPEAVAALKYTEGNIAKFPLADSDMDVWILGSGSGAGRMRVMVSAMEKDESLKYRTSLEKAGVNLAGAAPVLSAIGGLFEYSNILDSRAPCLFVHVGGAFTGIHLFNNGVPLFTRETPVGADALATTRIDDIETADPAPTFVTRHLTRLENELARSIDYYRNTVKPAPKLNGYIIGEGAIIKTLEARLSETFGMSFTLYNPFEDFISLGPDMSGRLAGRGSAYAIAAGLAVERGRRINLASHGRERRKPWSKRGGAVAATLMAALTLVTTMAPRWLKANDELDTRISILKAEIASLEKQRLEWERLSSTATALELGSRAISNQISAYPSTTPPQQDWEGLFHEIAISVPASSALTGLSINTAGEKQNGGARAPYEAGQTIRLEGLIRGPKPDRIAELNRLYTRLATSPSFGSVRLGGTRWRKNADGAGGDYMSFTITGRIRQNPGAMARPAAGSAPDGS